MMKTRKCFLAMLALTLAPMLSIADEAEWLVAPYIWYSSVSLDRSAGVGGSISASDLLDKSDSAGMIRIEVARGQWGVSVDYVFLSVSESVFLPSPPLPVSLNVAAELDTNIVELGGFYRPSGNDSGVNFLFGFRNINTDQTLLVTPGGGGPTERFDSDTSFTDVYLGARYLSRLTDRWDFTVRGDVSFGDTEGTFNFLASVGYRFNSTFALNLGYRHLNIEFEDDDSGVTETTEIEMTGPLLGFVFRF
jgi:hypothetical protein